MIQELAIGAMAVNLLVMATDNSHEEREYNNLCNSLSTHQNKIELDTYDKKYVTCSDGTKIYIGDK